MNVRIVNKQYILLFLVLLLKIKPTLIASPSILEDLTGAIDLETVLMLALKNNRDIKYAAINQKLAKERLKISYRRFLPELELGLKHNDSVVYGSPDSRVKQISIGLKQLIFDAGRYSSNLRMQKAENRLNELNLNLNREELIFSTINLYIEILKFRQKKAIQLDTYESALVQRKIAEQEIKLGSITELEFLDIDLGIKNIEIGLEETEQQERLLFFKLIRLLGYHPKAENPKLSGSINPEYSGFIEEHTPDYWLEKARKNSFDLIKKRFQLTSQREALRRAKSSWLPEITGNFSIFISGEEYPLSEPGFNLGINLSFPVPVVPIQAATSVGKKNPLERYRDINVSGRIAENLESLYSVAASKLNLSKSASELKDFEKDLLFSVQEVIFNIENHKKMLALLKEKLKIEQKRIAIQELKLELGEIKRIDLINQQIELAELKIEILTEIVSFYNQEISLLKMCGIPKLAKTYKYIILEQNNKP